MLKYRSDIDGLRSLAVVPVLLFHAEVFGTPGGFVGVDVFFVISGFLITSLLLIDAEQKKFSLLKFYDRRIRRILPAYLAVMAASTAAALAFLPPDELANYGKRLASTAVFASNFLFRSESNYFGPAAADNPLLHTWSLSVEEQFYIFWPLAIAALAIPVFARTRQALVAAALLISFVAAAYFAFTRPLSAFYQTPLRAWELLLGAAVAMGMAPRFGKWSGAAATAGLLLILVPVFTYRSGEVVFPGLGALPPVLGAALLLHVHAEHKTWVSRILGAKPLVHTGLISYSLYLWHWPILCFAHIELGRSLNLWEAMLALAASYAMAELSWRYVERPFRGHHKGVTPGLPRSIPIAVAILASLFAVGAGLYLTKGLPGRANPGTFAAAAQRDDAARGPAGCHVSATSTRLPDTGCLLGGGDEEKVQAILLGDSHAAAYAPAIAEVSVANGLVTRQWTKSSCAPIIVDPAATWRPAFLQDRAVSSCRTYVGRAVEKIAADPRIKLVFVAGFWSTQGRDEDATFTVAGPDAEKRFEAGLRPVVERLTAAGKSVVLLGQTPVFPSGGGGCLVRSRFRGRPDTWCGTPVSFQQAILAPSDRVLAKVTTGLVGAAVYKGTTEFCADGWCTPSLGGQVVMRDEHHLNRIGSLSLADGIAATVRSLRISTAVPG